MRETGHVAPSTVEEAGRLLRENQGALALAGGTDIVVLLEKGKIDPPLLVDLNRIPDLSEIEETNEGLKLGAFVSMTALAESHPVQKHYPALAEAARAMGCWQVRNLATLGGNLCNASPSADSGPPLLLYDAQVLLGGTGPARRLPYAAFPTGPGTTALAQGELLLHVLLPPPPDSFHSTYLRRQLRRSMDIPLVNVAAGLRRSDGMVTDARIALGAVSPIPYRCPQAEVMLLGGPLSEESIERAASAAADSTNPITDVRASAAYRRDMVAVCVRRALLQLKEEE